MTFYVTYEQWHTEVGLAGFRVSDVLDRVARVPRPAVWRATKERVHVPHLELLHDLG